MDGFLGAFFLLAGLIIGLGAVTVIDLHGFLGRRSEYWTEATARTHKVTKPLIWIGMALFLLGWILSYTDARGVVWVFAQAVIMGVLVLNGCFLSFVVSPYLLEKERQGRARQILPASWQKKIAASFLISFFGWWTLVVLTALIQARMIVV